MTPDEVKLVGTLVTSCGIGAVAFYFCLAWVKEIVKAKEVLQEERLHDLKAWNEYLKVEGEKRRDDLRILVSAIQDLTKLADSRIKPAG